MVADNVVKQLGDCSLQRSIGFLMFTMLLMLIQLWESAVRPPEKLLVLMQLSRLEVKRITFNYAISKPINGF